MRKGNNLGRPELSPERRKASTFSVRLTAEERETIEAAATAAGGLSASEWARRVLLEAAQRDGARR